MATAALLAAASYGWAQDRPPGNELTFDLGFGVDIDDNEGLNDPSLGTTSEVFTSLGVNFRNETTSDLLEFGISTRLQYEEPPNGNATTELLPPIATLRYSRFAIDSRLDVNARYFERGLDDTVFTFFDSDLNPVDFVVDSGELTQTTASVRYEAGIDGPLNFEVGARVDDRIYTDVFDPDLYDRRTTAADARVSFVISPVTTARIVADWTLFEAEDLTNTERTTTNFGVGATFAVTPSFEVDAEVVQTNVDSTDPDDERSGLGFSFSGTRDMPDGSITGAVERSIDATSERTLISVSRAMDLPDGELSYGLGYSIADEGDNVLLANLGFTRELPDGAITVSLAQTARGNDDAEDTRLTRLGVEFRRSINSVSGFTVGFGLGRTEDIGAGSAEETTRADLNLTYRRELTEDWDWSLGYTGRYLDDDGGTAQSNRFFTRIDRSFSIRP